MSRLLREGLGLGLELRGRFLLVAVVALLFEDMVLEGGVSGSGIGVVGDGEEDIEN